LIGSDGCLSYKLEGWAYIFKVSSQPMLEDELECFLVDVIDQLIKEAITDILSKYPL